jgi:hypothetical protein
LDVHILFVALMYRKNTGMKKLNSELHSTIAACYSSLSFDYYI